MRRVEPRRRMSVSVGSRSNSPGSGTSMELGAAGRIHRPWSPLQACRQPASASAASRLVAWWASVTSGNTSGWGDSGSTSSRSSSRSDGSVGFAVVPRPSAGSPTATTARSRVGIRLRGWGVRMLLATTAGADHLGPLVTFGAACHRFGHDVVVAAPECSRWRWSPARSARPPSSSGPPFSVSETTPQPRAKSADSASSTGSSLASTPRPRETN
jgi:hypothetical protein